jgi:hypothetical protein
MSRPLTDDKIFIPQIIFFYDFIGARASRAIKMIKFDHDGTLSYLSTFQVYQELGHSSSLSPTVKHED